MSSAKDKVKKKRSFFRFLQKMVEFYMSDANLRRDSFLKSKLSTDLELDMSLVVKCNRLAAVGATAQDVVTALKPSTMLQVQGEKIKRIKPIIEKTKEEVDRCTLYVERLPPDATHDWLSEIFSKYGPVAVVTVPKYKISRQVKGYAFVEFVDESSCVAAVEKYASLQPISCQMCPITNPATNVETRTIPSYPLPKTAIREVPVTQTPIPEKPSEPSESQQDQPTQPVTKKKNRKKKKWQKRINYAHMGLQVMSKTSWNELRDRYLSVQASNRRAVKSHLLKRPPPCAVGVGNALVPGSVLTLTAPEPVTDAESKSLRIAIRQLSEGVEYVDVEPGQQNGYVRTSGPEAAGKLLRVQHNLPGYRLHLLPSEAEHLYWVKIQHDRDRRIHQSGAKRRKLDQEGEGSIKRNVSGSRRLLLRAERQLAFKMRLSPNQC